MSYLRACQTVQARYRPQQVPAFAIRRARSELAEFAERADLLSTRKKLRFFYRLRGFGVLPRIGTSGVAARGVLDQQGERPADQRHHECAPEGRPEAAHVEAEAERVRDRA